MTRPVVITYTTIESGTTAYKTSLQERTLALLPTTFPNGSTIERTVTQNQVSTLSDRVTETVVYTSLQDGSTIYRTSFLERTVTSLPATPTTVEDGLGVCTSVLERTVTIERTIEHTVSLGSNSSIYATITTLQNEAAVNAAFPFWDDLLIAKGLPQGIFYQTEGATGNRSVTFEWYTTKYNNTINYAHFLVTFYEALPSWVTFE
jgi:hypothetical protein